LNNIRVSLSNVVEKVKCSSNRFVLFVGVISRNVLQIISITKVIWTILRVLFIKISSFGIGVASRQSLCTIVDKQWQRAGVALLVDNTYMIYCFQLARLLDVIDAVCCIETRTTTLLRASPYSLSDRSIILLFLCTRFIGTHCN